MPAFASSPTIGGDAHDANHQSDRAGERHCARNIALCPPATLVAITIASEDVNNDSQLLLGTSRQLAVGPTSSLAIVIATSVVSLADGDVSRAMALAGAVALMVGIVSIAGRFVGLANAAYFISDPILIGFKTGAALYIASTQLPKLFGIAGVSGNFFERVLHVVSSLPQTDVLSLVIGLAAIALFIGFEWAFPGRPTTLVVVVAAILVMTVFGLADKGIHIVGELPTGLPGISIPHIHLSDIGTLIPIALACFLLAYGELISVARSFAQKHGYDINPEQELTAIGTANSQPH